MPASDDSLPTDSEDDMCLLDALPKRRVRVKNSEPNQSNPPPESQTQATSVRKLIFREVLDHSRPKTVSENDTIEESIEEMTEETNARSKVASTDEVMTDTIAQVAEKDCVKLPPLRQPLSESEDLSDSERNIDRPDYNKRAHREGVVAWWDNKTGRGMIIDYRNSLEHKIELKDIRPNYGALVPGTMVEYEYSDDEFGKGFSKFWVVSGCEFVLWKDAWDNDTKYLYMQSTKELIKSRRAQLGEQVNGNKERFTKQTDQKTSRW